MALLRVCDVCGASEGDVKRIFFETDRTLDAAGSMDGVGAEYDLCLGCCGRLFRRVVLSRQCYSHDLGKHLVAVLEKMKNERG